MSNGYQGHAKITLPYLMPADEKRQLYHFCHSVFLLKRKSKIRIKCNIFSISLKIDHFCDSETC